MIGKSPIPESLQSRIISTWKMFKANSVGIPEVCHSEMNSLFLSELIEQEDLVIYEEIFQAMSDGYSEGMSKGRDYAKKLKDRSC